MKTSSCASGFVGLCITGGILSSLLIVAGCEAEPSEDFAVSISPQTARIRKNQAQAFVASGGVRYVWSLSGTNSATGTDESDPWGILSATTGDQVTYTSLRAPEAGQDYVVRVLTVMTTLGAEVTSNSTARSSSAIAYIYHIP
jgi:hypothetical protein